MKIYSFKLKIYKGLYSKVFPIYPDPLSQPILLPGGNRYCPFARFFVFGGTRLAVYSFRLWNHLAERLKTFSRSNSDQSVLHRTLSASGGLKHIAPANPIFWGSAKTEKCKYHCKEVSVLKAYTWLASHPIPRSCPKATLALTGWAQPLFLAALDPDAKSRVHLPPFSYTDMPFGTGDNSDFNCSGFYPRTAHHRALTGCLMTSPGERHTEQEDTGLQDGGGCPQRAQTLLY